MLVSCKKGINFPLFFFFFSFLLCLSSSVFAAKTYTSNTETECINGVCNQVIYSAPKFVEEDGVWKDKAQARSLKGKGIYDIERNLDANFTIEVLDFNETSVRIFINTTDLYQNTNVPFKVYNKYNESLVYWSGTYKLTKNKEQYYIWRPKEYFNISITDMVLKYGFNSTTIRVNVSSTGNDYGWQVVSKTTWTAILTNNTGQPTYLQSPVYVIYGETTAGAPWYVNARFFFNFNTSSIPISSTILSANITFYSNAPTIQIPEYPFITITKASHNNDTGVVVNTYYNKVIGYNSSYIKYTDEKNLSTITDSGFITFNVTNTSLLELANITKVVLRGEYDYRNISPIGTNEYNSIGIYTRDTGAYYAPYLQVVYTESASDTTSPRLNFSTNSTNGTWNRSNIYANFNASDETALSNITVFVYNGSVLYQSNTTTTSPANYNYTSLSNGTYYLNATAKDSSGNSDSSATNTIVIACPPVWVTTAYGVWANLTCTASKERNQTQNATQYDSWGCYGSQNSTLYNYTTVNSWRNTSPSAWNNFSCVSANSTYYRNISQNWTQLDDQLCGDNTTFFNNTYLAPALRNTSSFGAWANLTCTANNERNITQNLTQVDDYGCVNNTLFYNYSTIVSWAYTAYGAVNNESCVGTQRNITQNRTKYDEQLCGTNETLINSTLANLWEYTTYGILVNESCVGDQRNVSQNRTMYDALRCGDNTTLINSTLLNPSYGYTTYSSWYNITLCQSNDTVQQERNRTRYDNYLCEANTTLYEYQSQSCNYAAPSITILYPQSTTYTSFIDVLNYTVSDPNLDYCWYNINNGSNSTPMKPCVNITGLSSIYGWNISIFNGSNTWSLYANDTFGLVGSVTWSFIVSFGNVTATTTNGTIEEPCRVFRLGYNNKVIYSGSCKQCLSKKIGYNRLFGIKEVDCI